jgi:hypothetical protein
MRSKWLVSLSDGQTIREDKLLEEKPEISAWLRLKEYLLENKDKHITSIQLIVNGYIYNTPNIVNPKANDGNPCHLFFHKKSDFVFIGDVSKDEYYGFSYRIGAYRHYLWVKLKGNEVFTEIRDIKIRNQEKNIELFYEETQ